MDLGDERHRIPHHLSLPNLHLITIMDPHYLQLGEIFNPYLITMNLGDPNHLQLGEIFIPYLITMEHSN